MTRWSGSELDVLDFTLQLLHFSLELLPELRPELRHLVILRVAYRL